LKKFSSNNDPQQSGIEGDDGVHHDLASANNDNDNIDGHVPSHDGLHLAASDVTPSSLFSSAGKKVRCIHMFSIRTIAHSSTESFGKVSYASLFNHDISLIYPSITLYHRL